MKKQIDKDNQNEEQTLQRFVWYLTEREASKSTKDNYLRYVKQFLKFLGERKPTKELLMEYRSCLLESGLAHATINLKLVSVNRYLEFIGRPECKIKLLRIQRKNYVSNRITEKEFGMLLDDAYAHGEEKYYLIMRVLGATGIRIQELSNFTIQNIQKKKANIEIRNKNKCRIIVVPEGLREELLQYAKNNGITAGAVFRGNRGTAISRSAVWKKLKQIADRAGVETEKVHPHAFRHFFAFTYINKYKNVSILADILGHTSVETTRIYIQQTLEDTRHQLDELDVWKKDERYFYNFCKTG